MDESMTEEGLGALVAESFRAEAENAPGGAGLLQAVTMGVRRRAVIRRRLVVAGIAATVVGAVSLGIGLGPSARPGGGTEQAAAPGMQRSSFHHLRLEVPASWALNPEPCFPHGRDRVIDSPSLLSTACRLPLNEATMLGQQVLFSTGGTFSSRYLGSSSPTRPVTIDGVHGTLSSGTDQQFGMIKLALDLPSLDVSVLIEVRTQTLADTILDSARVIRR